MRCILCSSFVGKVCLSPVQAFPVTLLASSPFFLLGLCLKLSFCFFSVSGGKGNSKDAEWVPLLPLPLLSYTSVEDIERRPKPIDNQKAD